MVNGMAGTKVKLQCKREERFDSVSGRPFLKSEIALANFILSGNIPD